MDAQTIVSGKYFLLEKDDRFPLSLSGAQWTSLDEMRTHRGVQSLSIYALSGYNNLYIGSDSRESRGAEHRRDFVKGNHCNYYMQNTCNAYGVSGFYYTKILDIPQEYYQFRSQIENSYIKHFDTYNNGYNLVEFADAIMLGRKFTSEHITKLVESRRGYSMQQESRDKSSKTKTKPFTLLSPEGKIVSIDSVRKFCRENNLQAGGIGNLRRGAVTHYKQWRLPIEGRDISKEELQERIENDNKIKASHVAKETWFYKDGELLKIFNLKDYCRENNIHYCSMSLVYHGLQRRKSHKGYSSAKQLQLSSQELSVKEVT